MVTTFNAVRDFVRPLLGDTDKQRIVYSDAVIDQHIRLVIITHADAAVQENGESAQFTVELGQQQLAIMVFRVAKSIISPRDNFFSYKTPILTITRNGGQVQLMSYIDSNISKLSGGAIVIRSDNELQALLWGPDRFWNDFTKASA